MPTAYRRPDPKKQLSVRVRASVHAKLTTITERWKDRASAEGHDPEEIDLSYVVGALLDAKAEDELAALGESQSGSREGV